MPAPPYFFWTVYQFANSSKSLLICVEVSTGFGHASKAERMGDEGDTALLTLHTSAMTRMVPCIAFRCDHIREIADACDPGILGGTYSEHALSCAVGVATLQVVDEAKLLENSMSMGERLRDNLRCTRTT